MHACMHAYIHTYNHTYVHIEVAPREREHSKYTQTHIITITITIVIILILTLTRTTTHTNTHTHNVEITTMSKLAVINPKSCTTETHHVVMSTLTYRQHMLCCVNMFVVGRLENGNRLIRARPSQAYDRCSNEESATARL